MGDSAIFKSPSEREDRASSALHGSVVVGNTSDVKRLLRSGVLPNCTNAVGETPLHVAAQEGRTKIGSILIDFGANVNAVNHTGETPLHFAAAYGRDSMVYLLVRKGANIDIPTLQGVLPIQMAKTKRTEKIISKRNAKSPHSKRSSERKTIGNYILGDTLGLGTFSKVKVGITRSGEQVAIKMMGKKHISDPDVKKRFRLEVDILSIIDHPNIVKYLDYLEDEKRVYVVLEKTNGVELLDFIVHHEGAVSSAHCRRIFQQIVAAVEYLHELGIVHRDLKLENIIVMPDSLQIKIIDFGFSSVMKPTLLEENEEERREKNDGPSIVCKLFETIVGSPYYAAPELIVHAMYDRSVDLWSMGIVLFSLLVGHMPFEEGADLQQAAFQLENSLDFPPTVPEEAIDVIRSILRVNPRERMSFEQLRHTEWLYPCPDKIPVTCIDYLGLPGEIDDTIVSDMSKKFGFDIDAVYAILSSEDFHSSHVSLIYGVLYKKSRDIEQQSRLRKSSSSQSIFSPRFLVGENGVLGQIKRSRSVSDALAKRHTSPRSKFITNTKVASSGILEIENDVASIGKGVDSLRIRQRSTTTSHGLTTTSPPNGK